MAPQKQRTKFCDVLEDTENNQGWAITNRHLHHLQYGKVGDSACQQTRSAQREERTLQHVPTLQGTVFWAATQEEEEEMTNHL